MKIILRRFNIFIVGVLLSLVAILSYSSSAQAANFAVVAGNDGINNNGQCQLSEAIENINDQAQTNPDCPAGNGSDTIELPTGTITLTADLPAITRSITIQGQGMSQSVVDGVSQFEAFFIDNGPNANAAASGFKVQGYAGIGLVATSGDIAFEEIEVDGSNAANSTSGGLNAGFGANPGSADDYNVDFRNVYIHDIDDLAYYTNVAGVFFVMGGGANVNLNIENITIDNITSPTAGDTVHGIGLLNGAFTSGDSGMLNATVKNATISNVSSTGGIAGGVTVTTFNDDNATDVQSEVNVINSTVSDVGSAVASAVAGTNNPGAHVGAVVTLTNNVIANVSSAACSLYDLTGVFGNTGVVASNVINSDGGNVVDDSSCAAHLNDSTDKNNVTGLADSLGSLTDNGGYIPTMALLEGSPAVDAGVTVAGLSTDARLAARPQGNAYDSGAYESSFANTNQPDSSGGGNGSTNDKDQNQDRLADTGSNENMFLAIAAALMAGAFGVFIKSRKASI